MTILILANNDVGLYRFRKELLAALLEKQHRVVISLPDGDFIPALKEMGCEYLATPFESRGMDPTADFRLFCRYRRMLKEVRPDLVITYTVKPNVYGGLACRMAKIPYVCNVTGLGTALHQGGALHHLVSRLYRCGLKRASSVIFENSADAKTMCRLGVVTEKQVCVMPGAGVNLQEYDAAPYPADDGVTRFLYIGRLMREKGMDEFFACAEKLKAAYGEHVAFDMVGWLTEDYSEKCRTLEEEGVITFYGYRDDPCTFYDMCSCLVLPSYHEGMNNVLQEASATTRPLITTDIPGCREAVLDGISGLLCNPRDEKDLYRVMEQFHLLPYEEKRAMGLESRRLMELHFDRRNVVSRTMDVLFPE